MALQMPSVHNCTQLMQENEILKKRLRKLKHENNDMKSKLDEFKEEKRMKEFLQQYVTTRNIEVQTDPWKPFAGVQKKPAVKPETTESESQKVNKLLTMHSNLMKRYEKELKVNIQHMDTINHLNVQIGELEQKLRLSNARLTEFEAPANKSRSKCATTSSDHSTALVKELYHVRRQRDRLAEDKKKLKKELVGLDHGFFEEVEDLKFALQQSARLNKEYETCLKKMCKQFGVPYPNVEACLGC